MRCACGNVLRLEMARCPRCRQPSAYDPATRLLRTRTAADLERLCSNAGRTQLSCNWLAGAPGTQCMSCALTRTVPNLDTPDNRQGWRRFERAKRRVIAALLRIGLLPQHLYSGGWQLVFDLKQDRRDNPLVDEHFVLTGHIAGTITINLRETDSLRAEMTRREFQEPYRTLIGSLRHEIGHYFWSALVSCNDGLLTRFRELFGDERADYSAALAAHYRKFQHAHGGELRDHPDFITNYAQSHPWEDWAETWAHFMHMEDALATASESGMVREAALANGGMPGMLARWRSAIELANGLSVALGHRPAYPFLINAAVATKMEFIAEAVAAGGGNPFAAQEQDDLARAP